MGTNNKYKLWKSSLIHKRVNVLICFKIKSHYLHHYRHHHSLLWRNLRKLLYLPIHANYNNHKRYLCKHKKLYKKLSCKKFIRHKVNNFLSCFARRDEKLLCKTIIWFCAPLKGIRFIRILRYCWARNIPY